MSNYSNSRSNRSANRKPTNILHSIEGSNISYVHVGDMHKSYTKDATRGRKADLVLVGVNAGGTPIGLAGEIMFNKAFAHVLEQYQYVCEERILGRGETLIIEPVEEGQPAIALVCLKNTPKGQPDLDDMRNALKALVSELLSYEECPYARISTVKMGVGETEHTWGETGLILVEELSALATVGVAVDIYVGFKDEEFFYLPTQSEDEEGTIEVYDHDRLRQDLIRIHNEKMEAAAQKLRGKVLKAEQANAPSR